MGPELSRAFDWRDCYHFLGRVRMCRLIDASSLQEKKTEVQNMIFVCEMRIQLVHFGAVSLHAQLATCCSLLNLSTVQSSILIHSLNLGSQNKTNTSSEGDPVGLDERGLAEGETRGRGPISIGRK